MWPTIETHTFRYSTRPAICIKMSYLPLTPSEREEAWKLLENETMMEFFWMDARELIRDFEDEYGTEVYTGGRSGGWLYANISPDEFEHHKEFKGLARNIFDLFKEKFEAFASNSEALWFTDLQASSGIVVAFHRNRAVLCGAHTELAEMYYEHPPRSRVDCHDAITLLLTSAVTDLSEKVYQASQILTEAPDDKG